MPHSFEHAPTGRAKCRGCGQAIGKGDLRFGEQVPNPFGDDGSETKHWYHVVCAALTRPAAFLEALLAATEPIADRERLEQEATLGAAHERLPRARTAERAPTGRATCRACRDLIPQDTWRLALAYYEEGRFVPGGFIHARCAKEYFGTGDLRRRLEHFSPALTEADWEELSRELGASGQS
jgi:hypothetical protein